MGCVSKKMMLDKKTKDQLLSSSSLPRKRGQGNKESLAKKTSDISESLMNLNRTLAEQVKQSEMNITTLAGTTHTVNDTHGEFNNMTSHIQKSQNLLTKYGRREFTDKILIFFFFSFFFATVLY